MPRLVRVEVHLLKGFALKVFKHTVNIVSRVVSSRLATTRNSLTRNNSKPTHINVFNNAKFTNAMTYGFI